MAQTFDIRFARSAGLAGLFEAPANEFRWKGAGRLSIDASGISIAVRRGLLTLFARAQSRRIAANSLIEVYREGNALRLEFSTRESPRNVLPIWVGDRDAAAQIVTLLPTQRSVELEDSAGSPRGYRFDRKLVALLLGVLAIAVGVLLLPRYLAEDVAVPAEEVALATQDSTADSSESVPLSEIGPPTPATTARSAQAGRENRAPAYFDPATIPAPSMYRPVETVAPVSVEEEESATARESSRVWTERAAANRIVPGVPAKSAREIALEQLSLFRAESNVLRGEYLYARDSPDFERLEAIEARWLLVTSRIVNTSEFAGGEFYALRETELAISRNWRDYLRIHAEGLRTNDRRLIKLAAAHLAFAEDVEAQLSAFAP